MTCKEGQFDVAVELSINLNAQNVNGMTHFDLTGQQKIGKNTCMVIRYSMVYVVIQH